MGHAQLPDCPEQRDAYRSTVCSTPMTQALLQNARWTVPEWNILNSWMRPRSTKHSLWTGHEHLHMSKSWSERSRPNWEQVQLPCLTLSPPNSCHWNQTSFQTCLVLAIKKQVSRHHLAPLSLSRSVLFPHFTFSLLGVSPAEVAASSLQSVAGCSAVPRWGFPPCWG